MNKKYRKSKWGAEVYLICIVLVLIFRFLPCSTTLHKYAEKIALNVQYGKKRVQSDNIYMVNWKHGLISTKEKLKFLPSLIGSLIVATPYAMFLIIMAIIVYKMNWEEKNKS